MAVWVAVVVGGAMVVAGTVKAISGAKDKKKARNKQEAAEQGLADAQNALKNVDLSNPFAEASNAYAGLDNKMSGLDNAYDKQENVYDGMENKMEGQKNAFDDMENKMDGVENSFEDLQVNTQQAEFEAQQNQQMQANIMSDLSGAAGGSGIAALAQSMANQGSLQSQKASASIGAQEAANTKLAAKADQDINMASATEASKMQTMQASEQSRLDTQARSADMDIQKTQMSAEEAMQAARLGEESKLQMAEATEASRLQTQEAAGEMEVQKLKGEGDMWSAEQEMVKQSTLMDSNMKQAELAAAEKKAGDEKMWGGISDGISGIGKIFSDKRLKENIIKIKYSDSGIPIYHFNYIGEEQTWSGTMAQDLLELGKEKAVGSKNGYYTVDYNLIDINMKKVIPSPLKQLGKTPQEEMKKQKTMTNDGLDILGGAQDRKGWGEMQMDIKNIEPEKMKRRKLKDQILRDKERRDFDTNQSILLSQAYSSVGHALVKKYKNELYEALQTDDEETQKEIKRKLASLAQNLDAVKESVLEFYEDHFKANSLLSKGVSAQQVSFATQMYCKNPELIVTYAVDEDVINGYTDYFGEIVMPEQQYCIVYDFNDRPVMISVLDGNRDMYLRNNLKAIEYITFLNETHESALEANKNEKPQKIDLGRINYKIDSMFGYNDGTASKEQDELVMMFCHDSEVLRDGSTFRRHLYEHPNITNLNYGGFDWDAMEFNLPLGPEDTNHWADEISDTDKLLLVDALTNVDNPYFDKNLLRTLVKEYYTYKIENSWWKGMGYPQGKLDVMRLKQNSLKEARFKKEKSAAAEDGMLNFLFDGKVHPTGMTKEKVKKMEEDRSKAANKNNPQLNK